MGHFTDAEPRAKGSVCSAPSLRSIAAFLPPERNAGGLVGLQDKVGVKEMQTRRTNLDPHQDGLPTTKLAASAEAELIGLARSKGQFLTEHTLRLIRETLELRGVTLTEFVVDVRPHFRNNILNPSGFLIDRARRFHQLSQPAAVPVSSAPVQTGATVVCGACKGQQYVLTEKDIEPCRECSTAEFRREWEIKETERAQKIRASLSASRSKVSPDDGE